MSNTGFQQYLDEQTRTRMLFELRRQILQAPPPPLGFTPCPSPLTTLTPNPNHHFLHSPMPRLAAPPFNGGLGVRQESRIHKPGPMMSPSSSHFMAQRQNRGGHAHAFSAALAAARRQSRFAMHQQQQQQQREHAVHQVNFNFNLLASASSSQPNAMGFVGKLDAHGNLVVPPKPTTSVTIHEIEDDDDHCLDLSLRL